MSYDWDGGPPDDASWRPVKGFEEQYLVSDDGRIYSLVKKRLRATPLHKGYPIVMLYKNDGHRGYTKQVHRIVAEAFIPNPDGKRTVNHINGDRSDNRVENLEWASYREQIEHRFNILKSTKTSNRPVLCLDTGETFASISEAAQKKKSSRSRIWDVCNGNKKHAGGFRWKYL